MMRGIRIVERLIHLAVFLIAIAFLTSIVLMWRRSDWLLPVKIAVTVAYYYACAVIATLMHRGETYAWTWLDNTIWPFLGFIYIILDILDSIAKVFAGDYVSFKYYRGGFCGPIAGILYY